MLIASDIQSKEPICFGPFCNTISTATQGEGGNGVIAQLFGSTLGKLINLFVVFIGLVMLIYLLWGTLDWITSGGDKEKLEKARHKLVQAIIGMLVVFGVLMLFGLLAGDILGIITKNPDGTWGIRLPMLSQ